MNRMMTKRKQGSKVFFRRKKFRLGDVCCKTSLGRQTNTLQ